MERILSRPLQPPEWRTCPRTSFSNTNPESRTGERGACDVKGGMCGPVWTNLWERTDVYSGMSLSETPDRILTFSWYLGASVVPPNGSIPAT